MTICQIEVYRRIKAKKLNYLKTFENISFLEMHYLSSAPETSASDNLDRGKFRDHYTNEVCVS
jgi:hypothetical protein